MKVVSIYEGHYDEITKLVVVGTNIISSSLDGTIRTWDTHKPPKPLELQNKEEPPKEAGLLTEEEERELAELMSDEDDN
jgi:WD40 repeat protein